MTQLDREWAIQQLRDFIHLTDYVAYTTPGVIGSHQRGSDTDASSAAHVAEEILDRVLPTWRRERSADVKLRERERWDYLRHWASRAIAQLSRDEELREKLGDGAPSLDAGKFHPWVWEAARSLWSTGHFAHAVNQAAVHINARTQAKCARRDVSETDLFRQAFSIDDPESGKPRLRLMDNDGSATFKSRQRGAMALAEGLYASFRNPASHDIQAELDEQLALERLAAFSVLARLVDEAALLQPE